MQFIPEGPNIPEALLNAHADGQVVFFCGAGVSVDAGYPLFSGLVRELRDLNPVTKTPELEDALQREDYDFSLSILQSILGKRNPKLRLDTQHILSRRPQTLENHRTILRLSRQRDETCRLITTNFDRLFIKAAKGLGKIHFDGAPKLPVPRPDRWNSVVHLHGILPVNGNAGELSNLVLNSADFGEAYITESYCSRFVVELLRHFTVVFIGYSLNDKVMRYLMDAISFSERHEKSDGTTHFHRPFAFVDHSDADKEELRQRWELRGVIPIPYAAEKKRGGHHRLYQTLASWADLAAGGQRARATLALNEAQKPFLPEDTFTQERLLWALKDDSGKAAEALANTRTLAETASIEWLPVFAANGLLDQVYSSAELQAMNAKRLRNNESDDLDQLKYRGTLTNGAQEAKLKPVTEHLIWWMQRHIDKIELADWFVTNGGVPHPLFSWVYNHSRNKENREALKEPEQRKLWDIITSDTYKRSHTPAGYWFDLRDDIDLLNRFDATELVTHVMPKLEIRPSIFRDFEDRPQSFLGQFEFNLKFANDQLDYQVKQIIANADRHVGLEALFEPLTQVIVEGLNWLALIGKVSRDSDLTGYSIPSISDHEQNNYVNRFWRLIFLLRSSFDRLLSLNSDDAVRAAQKWLGIDYPLFKRLFLYAANKLGHPLDTISRDLLIGNQGCWLWALDTNHETKVYLRERVKDWTPSDVEKLCETILAGPERGRFREMRDAEWADTRDRYISRHLKKLEQGGVQLPTDSHDKLNELNARYPYVLPDNHSDEFVVFSGPVRNIPWDENIVSSEYQEFSDLAAEARVANWDSNRNAEYFRKLAFEQPVKAVETLEEGLAQNLLEGPFWREGFYGLSKATANIGGDTADAPSEVSDSNNISTELPSDLLDRTLTILENLPENVLTSGDVADALVEFWRTKPVKTVARDRYLAIWDRLWTACAKDPAEDREAKEAVGYAINDAAGKLTEEIVLYLWPKQARVNGGLPTELTDRLSRIVGRTDHHRVDASSVIVASRLDILHAIDPIHAEKILLPLLEWDTNQSASAYWHAFLWTARISPDLYRKIETNWIIAFEHPDWFEKRSYEILCQLFLLASMEFQAVTPENTKRVLGGLSVEALRNMSSFIRQRILNAKEDSAKYWEKTIQPWLSAYWPRDHTKRSIGIMEDFAMAAIYCGDRFPQAVGWFEENGLLGATVEATTILFALKAGNGETHEDFKDSNSLPERFPAQVLHLLWITRPFRWDHGYAQTILHRIIEVQPPLAQSAEYQDIADLLGI